MTKRDHSGDIKGFHINREAWYFRPEQLNDEDFDNIMIGMYCPDGGTSGEFSLNWLKIGGDYTAQLQVYSDGWSALKECSDLVEALVELDKSYTEGSPSREDIKQLLLSLEYCDLTKRNYEDN